MGCVFSKPGSKHVSFLDSDQKPESEMLNPTKASGRQSVRIKELDHHHPTSESKRHEARRRHNNGAAVATGGVAEDGAEDKVESRLRERLLVKQEASPRISGNIAKTVDGGQIAAGWPAWLSAVAAEAINGWIPQSLSCFKILEMIGEGSYSVVYKARDTRHRDTEKIVALKKVRFDAMKPHSVQFMAREIKVLRRLDHPNVVKLEGLAISWESDSLYLIFEYMEHDLGRLTACAETPFSEAQAKCYLQQLLRGLEHCHSHGVLHRDIKGPNLLLGNDGVLKIADFGLAKFYHADQKQQLTPHVVTRWYRPPELLLGATEYGVAVDLWSTGCILAELLTGKPLMPGRSEVDQLHRIFKLCGSPSEEYWKKSGLLNTTLAKPLYKRCIAKRFKKFSSSSIALLETLLAIEPEDRGNAAAALKSEFFTKNPLASDLSSFPKYPPNNSINAQVCHREASRLAKTIATVPPLEEKAEPSVSSQEGAP